MSAATEAANSEVPSTPQSASQAEIQSRFDKIVMVLMALVTLWGAVVAILENRASISEDLAAQQAQAEAVVSLGEIIRADLRSTYGQDVYATWDVAGQRAAQAQASTDAARLRGDESHAQVLESAAARWQHVQDSLAGLTPLMSAEFGADTVAYTETLRRKAYLGYEQQQAALEAADGYGDKADTYMAVITTLTVVLFLLGVSLTMNNWLRYVFVAGGMLLSAVSVIWVLFVALQPVYFTPPEAMEHFVDGYIASNIAYSSFDEIEAAQRESQALQSFDAAIALYDGYANAYQWRGYTLLEKRVRGADPERNAKAVSDIERAIQLGNANSVTYTNLGWAQILAGDYKGAVQAAQRAIELNPAECVAHLNLGWAHLALDQTLQSNKAYEVAVECILQETPSNQDWLFNAGVSDLHDMQVVLPGREGVDAALERLKETSASITLFGKPVPRGTSAEITGLRFASDVTSNDEPANINTAFAANTTTVYAFVSYDQMQPDMSWMVRWYLDGELYDWFVSEDWPYDARGEIWVSTWGSPLPAGEYLAEVYVDGNLLAADRFKVEIGTVVDVQPYQSDYFGVTLNYPVGWTPVEEATEDGYLYFSPPDDDTRYFMYLTLPWEGDSQSVLAAGMEVWREDFPDVRYGEQSVRFMGHLTDARAVQGWYTDNNGIAVSALLMGAVDARSQAHFIVVQAPAAVFDSYLETHFRTMLDSFEIVQ